MPKIAIPYHELTIRRDANTITPIQVPAHEKGLLGLIFGKENVEDGGQVAFAELDTEQEYERLCAKYGPGPVAKFYGEDGGERLQELIQRSVENAEKTSKKAAKTQTV